MKYEDVEAYPLCWPDGWPRTPAHLRDAGNKFGSMEHVPSTVTGGSGWHRKRPITFDRARRSLRDELGRLGAKAVIMSTNARLRSDGEPRADDAEKRSIDPGIAVYFMLKGKQMVMAQDAFQTLAANARSLSLAIDALRALERHGGGTMMERAFSGFTALPAPEGSRPKRAWWTVLNYSENPDDREDLSVDEVKARFNTLAKKRHPDMQGGNTEAFAELVEARDEAIQALGGET